MFLPCLPLAFLLLLINLTSIIIAAPTNPNFAPSVDDRSPPVPDFPPLDSYSKVKVHKFHNMLEGSAPLLPEDEDYHYYRVQGEVPKSPLKKRSFWGNFKSILGNRHDFHRPPSLRPQNQPIPVVGVKPEDEKSKGDEADVHEDAEKVDVEAKKTEGQPAKEKRWFDVLVRNKCLPAGCGGGAPMNCQRKGWKNGLVAKMSRILESYRISLSEEDAGCNYNNQCHTFIFLHLHLLFSISSL